MATVAERLSALRAAQSSIDSVLRVVFASHSLVQIAAHPGSQLTNVCHLPATERSANVGTLLFTLRPGPAGDSGILETTMEINHSTVRDAGDTLRFRLQPLALDEVTAFARSKAAQFSALYEKHYDLGMDEEETRPPSTKIRKTNRRTRKTKKS
ncbi:MAG: hypothetical protein HYY93_07510 [Planctomycetes bacterium]|nr:hypothetical protein [Planctomycetota bacterium]